MEKKFMKGMVLSGWRKIEPRDWYYENNGREISYGSFRNYVNRLWINKLKSIWGDFMYGRKEEKKQLRRDWYIGDYYEYMF